ncbi:MAG: pH regulation protein F [Chloroflexi bacterium]|nr:pH regulation protein F [Chloroflexota bacterium]MYB84697.1 pH regulation protein F [Chloroflexota bacterium]
MSVLFVAVLAVAVAINAALFYRLLVGRTPFDRLLAAAAIGTNAVILLVLIGFVFERPDMFVDLALSYALLNFIGTVVVGKYLETRQHQLWSLIRSEEEEV